MESQTSELAEMDLLLQEMLQPNTEIVRKAVDCLNKRLKQSASMPLLLQLFHSSPHPEVGRPSSQRLSSKTFSPLTVSCCLRFFVQSWTILLLLSCRFFKVSS